MNKSSFTNGFLLSTLMLFSTLAAGENTKLKLPDDSYYSPRTVFVTPPLYNGYLDGLAGADEICNENASALDSIVPAGDYVAILSDSNTSAASRVGVSIGPIINTAGEPVAENVTALLSGIRYTVTLSTIADGAGPSYRYIDSANVLSSPINRTATGQLVGANVLQIQAWTGSELNGQPISDDPTELCSNWTSADASKQGKGIGLPWERRFWIAGEYLSPTVNQFSCDRLKSLFCIQRY